MEKKLLNKMRIRRKRRIRAKIRGTAQKPRLSVFKSNRFFYAQLINDTESKTLASASGQKPEKVGEEIAKKAKSAGVTHAVFDKGPYAYHGTIKKLCEAARSAGLKI